MGQAVGAEPVEKALTNLASAAIGESTVTKENLLAGSVRLRGKISRPVPMLSPGCRA